MSCSQELFKKVVPHHYLGFLWSQLDKKSKEHLAPAVRATITQFNSFKDQSVTARDRDRYAMESSEGLCRVVETPFFFFFFGGQGFLPSPNQPAHPYKASLLWLLWLLWSALHFKGRTPACSGTRHPRGCPDFGPNGQTQEAGLGAPWDPPLCVCLCYIQFVAIEKF